MQSKMLHRRAVPPSCYGHSLSSCIPLRGLSTRLAPSPIMPSLGVTQWNGSVVGGHLYSMQSDSVEFIAMGCGHGYSLG